MKKLIGIILLVSFLFSCSDNKELSPDFQVENLETRSSVSYFPFAIGEVINDEAYVTADEDLLKSRWSKFLHDKAELELTFDVLKMEYDGNNYFLTAKDYSNGSSGISLVLDGGLLYEARVGGGKTVTCTGCTSTGEESAGECDAQQKWLNDSSSWYCTECSQGECTKTTTVDAFIPFGVLGYTE